LTDILTLTFKSY